MSGIPRDGLPPGGAFRQVGPDEWVEAEPLRVPAWARKPMRPFMEIARRRAKIWMWISVPLCVVGLILFAVGDRRWYHTLGIIGLAALTRATHWTGVSIGLRRRAE